MDSIERNGRLVRGPDGVLYDVSDGCEAVTQRRAPVFRHLSCQAKRRSGVVDTVSARTGAYEVADPGDYAAAIPAVDPGDYAAAIPAVDPGDYAATIPAVDPGDYAAAIPAVDPGDYAAAIPAVDTRLPFRPSIPATTRLPFRPSIRERRGSAPPNRAALS